MIPLTPMLLVSGAAVMAAADRQRRWPSGGAAFVHHVGYHSHYDHFSGQSSWPLPNAERCEELAQFAAEKRILVADAPLPGDVFLEWCQEKRCFTQAGVVATIGRRVAIDIGPASFQCQVIEGGGTLREPGARERDRVFWPARGDRLIRWVDLDRRAPDAAPVSEAERCAEWMRLVAA
jgi:hypothetical protein